MRILSLILFLSFSTLSVNAQTEDRGDMQKLLDFFCLKGIDITHSVNNFLYHTVFDWYEVPYRYAGSTTGGIDCSGFVKMVYNKVFSCILQGGSADLIQKCREIEPTELKEGDLLFFKIRGDQVSHVGIYLMDGKFAHATTRLGVTISDLTEEYYKRTFFKAGRLNP